MTLELARVAIISDTHTHLDSRIAELIRDCEYAVHAGDIGCNEILEQMQPKLSCIAVVGNNDFVGAWPEEQSHIVEKLPQIAELHLPGGILAIEHGHRHGHHKPDHKALRASHPSARAVVYGHTHKIVCDTSEEMWVLNPGAAGQTRNHGGPSCLLLTAANESWQLQALRFSPE